MRPIWKGYAGYGILFVRCWMTFHELIRLVQVAGWVFMAQTGSLVMDIPSMLILWRCACLICWCLCFKYGS